MFSSSKRALSPQLLTPRSTDDGHELANRLSPAKIQLAKFLATSIQVRTLENTVWLIIFLQFEPVVARVPNKRDPNKQSHNSFVVKQRFWIYYLMKQDENRLNSLSKGKKLLGLNQTQDNNIPVEEMLQPLNSLTKGRKAVSPQNSLHHKLHNNWYEEPKEDVRK